MIEGDYIDPETLGNRISTMASDALGFVPGIGTVLSIGQTVLDIADIYNPSDTINGKCKSYIVVINGYCEENVVGKGRCYIMYTDIYQYGVNANESISQIGKAKHLIGPLL